MEESETEGCNGRSKRSVFCPMGNGVYRSQNQMHVGETMNNISNKSRTKVLPSSSAENIQACIAKHSPTPIKQTSLALPKFPNMHLNIVFFHMVNFPLTCINTKEVSILPHIPPINKEMEHE